MNHRKAHDRIIERARNRVLEGYSERHHIIPRCLGGSNSASNIVRLIPEEHYVVRLLLVKLHPGHAGLASAAFLMCRSSAGRTQRNNKGVGWVRRAYATAKKGWTHSPEVRAEIAAKNRGKVRTEAFKADVAAFHTGRKRSKQTCASISEAQKRRMQDPAVRAILAKPKSPETRKRMSEARRRVAPAKASALQERENRHNHSIPASTRGTKCRSHGRLPGNLKMESTHAA